MTEREHRDPEQDPNWQALAYPRFYATVETVKAIRRILDQRRARKEEKNEGHASDERRGRLLRAAADIVRFRKRK